MIDLNKIILTSIFLVIVVFSSSSYSKEIGKQQATKVALNFVQSKNRDKDREISIDKTIPILYDGVVVSYLLTLQNNGFVFLSADDNSKPILAYSLENNYIKDNPHQQVLIEYYNKSVYQIKKEKIENDKFREEWKLLLDGSSNLNRGKSVTPLTVTKWGQGSGFNRFCPPGCYAGCGTIAIAQYMYFYKCPVQGEGAHSYVPQNHPEYGTLSADFGSTTYNWEQMSTTISDVHNATLIYHVAVAGEALFDPSGTFILPIRVPYLLETYFRYNDYISTKYRDDCTEEEWNNHMTRELDKGHIVLYNGYSYVGDNKTSTNAHYFLLDGYNSDNHFHINWGWYGSSNGYYYLNSLVTHGGTYDWATFGNRVFTNAYPKDNIIVNDVSPSPGTISLLEMESEAFSVTAYHTEGNLLNYRWKVDGALQSSSSSFVFYTDYNSQGSYKLTLDIFESSTKDERSAFLEWDIVVEDKDRPIIITDLIPADHDFNPIDQLISVDGAVDFSISAYDPDGSSVNYRWELDSDSVSIVDSYQFVADSSLTGEHNLSLIVHDHGGDLFLYEGFENGELSSAWNTGGDADWQVSGEGDVWDGFSVKSGNISDNQDTEISINIEIEKYGQINFYKKISSESGAPSSFYDGLYFYIDEILKGKWQGESAWSQSSYPITVGSHELKWSYKKDSGTSSGEDCAWIDEVTVTTEAKNDTKNVIVKNWLITVQEAADQPPVITPISDQSLVEGELLSLTVSAEDPDGDTVFYFEGAGFTSGMNLDSLSGLFSWQTDYLDSGSYSLEIIVKSGIPQLADIAYFNITVGNAIPQIPANLLVTVNDSIIEFSWDEEADVHYEIISSGDAYSDKNGWVVEEILDSGAVWQDTVDEPYKCYSIASILGDTSSDYCQSVGYRLFSINTENFTMVSLPFDTDITTAQEFLLTLNGDSKGGAESISRWGIDYGQWEQYLNGFSTTDFAVQRGSAYMLYNVDDNLGRFIVTGDISAPASFDIIADDFTIISVPLNRSDIFNASSLAEAIGGEDGGDVESISKWDPVLKEWKQYIVGSSSSDFDLSFGDGVLIYKLTPLAGWNSTKFFQPILYRK